MADSGVVTLKEYWLRLFGEQMYEEWTIAHNSNIVAFINTPMTKLSFEMLHAIGVCDMIRALTSMDNEKSASKVNAAEVVKPVEEVKEVILYNITTSETLAKEYEDIASKLN